MFELARRNDVAIPFHRVEDVRAAYRFTNLQSFLDIYYQSCAVLLQEKGLLRPRRGYLSGPRPKASATPRSSSTPRPTRIAASRSPP